MAIDILPLNDWLETERQPLIISGPCSAETEEQLLSTARQIALLPQVKVFRAGIWKPRTRPEGFQGMGEQALLWLRRVKEQTSLLTAVEVANPAHIDLALKHEVDILWLGARTVVNPFSVQEISDALEGIDIPVMVKNPLNPDLKLWIGALERLNQVGIRKLIAIHRGFFYYQRDKYRNSPMWEIPIELKRLYPTLPVLCDPSHICGKVEYLQDISQKALDLDMQGLMIESHIDPGSALSDADQQITPAGLAILLDGLILRKANGFQENPSRLEELRAEIDRIDWTLLDTLTRRMKVVDEIGAYKKVNNITILQIKRWRNIILDRLQQGGKLGLSKEFLMRLLELVHRESIQRQMDIMNDKDQGETN